MSSTAKSSRVTGRQRGDARTCVGCHATAPLEDTRRATARSDDAERCDSPLVRLVASDDGEVAVDSGDGKFGRGAYVHADRRCIAGAAQRGLARSFKRAVRLTSLSEASGPLTEASLASAVASAYERKVAALISAARRARWLEAGSEAVCAAVRNGKARLVVVAADAAQAAELSEVRRAVREGKSVVWGDKARLAAAVFGDQGGEIGVAAVTDVRLANAIFESWLIVSSMSVASGAGEAKARGAKSIVGGRAARVADPSELSEPGVSREARPDERTSPRTGSDRSDERGVRDE